MRMVRPKLKTGQISVGENQPEYKTITMALVKHPDFPGARGLPYNSLVAAFQLSPEERQRLIDGELLYVSLLTDMQMMQPVIVLVGTQETATLFNVEPEL